MKKLIKLLSILFVINFSFVNTYATESLSFNKVLNQSKNLFNKFKNKDLENLEILINGLLVSIDSDMSSYDGSKKTSLDIGLKEFSDSYRAINNLLKASWGRFEGSVIQKMNSLNSKVLAYRVLNTVSDKLPINNKQLKQLENLIFIYQETKINSRGNVRKSLGYIGSKLHKPIVNGLSLVEQKVISYTFFLAAIGVVCVYLDEKHNLSSLLVPFKACWGGVKGMFNLSKSMKNVKDNISSVVDSTPTINAQPLDSPVISPIPFKDPVSQIGAKVRETIIHPVNTSLKILGYLSKEFKSTYQKLKKEPNNSDNQFLFDF